MAIVRVASLTAGGRQQEAHCYTEKDCREKITMLTGRSA